MPLNYWITNKGDIRIKYSISSKHSGIEFHYYTPTLQFDHYIVTLTPEMTSQHWIHTFYGIINVRQGLLTLQVGITLVHGNCSSDIPFRNQVSCQACCIITTQKFPAQTFPACTILFRELPVCAIPVYAIAVQKFPVCTFTVWKHSQLVHSQIG